MQAISSPSHSILRQWCEEGIGEKYSEMESDFSLLLVLPDRDKQGAEEKSFLGCVQPQAGAECYCVKSCFIQDEVGEQEVILSLLWEINSYSKSFLIINFNISWQNKTAHKTSNILTQQDSPNSQVRFRNLNTVEN